ncbi:Casein kinase I isoform alpha [Mortierella antarctica]|nr:Casein kinase I isoform alpha [Mortierella antarctica]
MGSSTTIIGGEYQVLGKIGEGSFGEVFRAKHIATGVDYAVKREPVNELHPQLTHEAKMYEKLAGGVGISNLRWFGREGAYNALVIDLLGPNLKQVRRENEKFPLSFVIELGVQMIEFIHKKGIVYRDIKPENFLLDADIDLPEAPMGKAHTPPTYPDQTMSFFNDTRQRQYSIESDHSMLSNLSSSPGSPIVLSYGKPHLSIVDFGLAAYYRDASGKHIPNKGNTKHKIGTARYASINIHAGREHSRRDDIESIGYMLLEFLIGTLPWSGITARTSRQGWAKMREIKEDTDLDELCDGLPRGFMTYIGYARSLKFDEEPDYEYLRKILQSSAGRGSEAQTVRCHKENQHSSSLPSGRSLEQCFKGLDIRPHDRNENRRDFKESFKTKALKDSRQDWRARPEYIPPTQEELHDFNPNSPWTITPPDVSKRGDPFSITANESSIHDDFKDKMEWGSVQGSFHDQDTDRSNFWPEEKPEIQPFHTRDDPQRTRKSSWGDDDPTARWGHDEVDPTLPLQNPTYDWSQQGTVESSDARGAGPGGKGNKGVTNGKHKNGTFGRQFAPQDARLYSNEPPFGLLPRSGGGGGGNQDSFKSPMIPYRNKNGGNNRDGATGMGISLLNSGEPGVAFAPLLSKDVPLPLSPKLSLASSFPSGSNTAGVGSEPGIELSRASANRPVPVDMNCPGNTPVPKLQSPRGRHFGFQDRGEHVHCNGNNQRNDYGYGDGHDNWNPHGQRRDRQHGSISYPDPSPSFDSPGYSQRSGGRPTGYKSGYNSQYQPHYNQQHQQQQYQQQPTQPHYRHHGHGSFDRSSPQSPVQSNGYYGRRRSRSRKNSNASQSSLEHRGHGTFGNAAGAAIKMKPK